MEHQPNPKTKEFATDLHNLVAYFLDEKSLSLAEMVGVLEVQKLWLMHGSVRHIEEHGNV